MWVKSIGYEYLGIEIEGDVFYYFFCKGGVEENVMLIFEILLEEFV